MYFTVIEIACFNEIREAMPHQLKSSESFTSHAKSHSFFQESTELGQPRKTERIKNFHVAKLSIVIYRPHMMGEENHNQCCYVFFPNSAKSPRWSG